MSQSIPTSETTSDPLSLDSIFKKLQHWRDNKAAYPENGIPSDIWEMIFKLEGDDYPAKDLRGVLRINTQQYAKKRAEFYAEQDCQGEKSSGSAPTKPVDVESETSVMRSEAAQFVQAVVEGESLKAVPSLAEACEKTKQAIKQLKSTANNPAQYLEHTTIVVECTSPDGHRLSIHTTDSHIDLVMQAFYRQGALS